MKKYLLWCSEVIIVVAVFFVVENYLERQDLLIKADGKGYYDYLPAAFIYNDLNFQYTDTLVTEYYNHKSYGEGYFKQVHGKRINKYFPGVAILWVPFFAGSHYYALNTHFKADGYSLPYQMGVYAGALFYLWLGLFFLRLILQLKNTSYPIILLVQIIMALGTPILNYVHFDASFVHVYAFALINIFFYLLLRYTHSNKPVFIVLSGFLLGLIVLMRPVNIMAVLLIFLCFSSLKEMKNWWSNLFSVDGKHVLLGFLSFVGVAMFAPLLWKWQTNHFFIWGYQGESFNFLSPTVFNFLFSFRKGLFIHTPILGVLFFAAVFVWLRAKKYYQVGTFIVVSYIIVYVLSSWWSWYYGTSFGSRPSIDYYVIFALMTAHLFENIKKNFTKAFVAILLVLMVPINIIQAFQYQHYIIDWDEMTFGKFNIIRLNTDNKYRGIFFQPKVKYTDNQILAMETLPLQSPIVIAHGMREQIFETKFNIPNEGRVNHAHVEMDMTIESGNSDVILTVLDSNEMTIFQKRMNSFKAIQLENTRGTGNFFFSLENIPQKGTIQVEMQTWNDEVIINSFTLFLVSK